MIDHAAALALTLEHEPVPAEQVVAGQPTTGLAELGVFDGHGYGVWEMTPGAMSDVEADEMFVVLAGAATVEFVEAGYTLELGPGFVGQLLAGTRTIWTVTESLRKIYIG